VTDDAPARADAGSGLARVHVRNAGGETRLALLEQRTPLRVLFPQVPAGEVPEAALINTGGGVVGGDRLAIEIVAGAGTRLRATSQAAEKVYRSAGPASTLQVRLSAGQDAWLEWLPQETILFDRCSFRRQILLELAPSARLLAGEITILGRSAHGERLSSGSIRDRWAVRSGGRLLWADALRLEGELETCLEAPFGFAGAKALATLVYAAEDARRWLEPARGLIGAEGTHGRRHLPPRRADRPLARRGCRGPAQRLWRVRFPPPGLDRRAARTPADHLALIPRPRARLARKLPAPPPP
jgi:urease accessory protein